MKPYKAVVINDEWIRQISNYGDSVNINGTDGAYTRIPLIYRAVKMNCNSLTRIPIHVYEGETEIDWPYQQSLKHILWQTEASHLLKGGAVWLKLRNRYNLDKGIQVLNPFTVQITFDYKTGERTFDQYLSTGQHYGPWSESEVIFWREYSPIDDVGFGTAAAEVALGDSQIMHYLSAFQKQFFKSGAQPTTLIGLEDATPTEVDRMQTWFEKSISGVSKAWRIMALRGKVNPVILTPTFKDMALPEVRNQAFAAVAQAFGIPETMLMGNSANYATAETDKMTYITDTIGPRAMYYQDGLNDYLEPTGYRIEFGVEELSEMQEDETMRAQAYSGYVNAGMPEEVARSILGIDIPPDVQGIWDKYLARKEEQANKPKPENPDNSQLQDTMAKSLDKWKRKALKRFDEGKSPAVEFVSDEILDAQMKSVQSKLAVAKTREDVMEAFGGS